jgi:integrase
MTLVYCDFTTAMSICMPFRFAISCRSEAICALAVPGQEVGGSGASGWRRRSRRSVSLIKNKGAAEELVLGKPKSGKARVVDLDAATLATLKAHRATQGTLSLSLARDDAYVLATLDGVIRHPERFSRTFVTRVAAARRELGEDALPAIRLHDLRHTHATVLLRAGAPVKVVSERLGHANATITLGVYAHVMPGMQREAADKFAALVFGGA